MKTKILGKGDVVWTYCSCGEHDSECESRPEFIHDKFVDWYFEYGGGYKEFGGSIEAARGVDMTDEIEDQLVFTYIEDNRKNFLNTFGVQWKEHKDCKKQ